ncbi:MAG TPA: molybdopterin-binding protein [Burkholderiaceae bacterium]|jgi:DMSO/TMAO reductase YedYZ molybdopterin-dependent catalytic subunit
MKRLRYSPRELARRRLLSRIVGGGGALLLGGCDRLGDTAWFPRVLASAEALNRSVHHLASGKVSMAQEFTPADLSPSFRGNGNTDPDDDAYVALAANGFADWKLVVDGLVDKPAALSLAQLRAMSARTQITRHDCVEGWSAIGKWTGVPLARVLDAVQPRPQARYVVFHCADSFEDGDVRTPYYESIDMLDAYHPQTLLAYELNDQPLPVLNGAPLRLRVERQLGYKHAKYLMRLELVETFAEIGGGNGGYWEDQGYQWYAGI